MDGCPGNKMRVPGMAGNGSRILEKRMVSADSRSAIMTWTAWNQSCLEQAESLEEMCQERSSK